MGEFNSMTSSLKSLENQERQIAEDLCSYLRAYNATDIAVAKAIDDTAEIYNLSSHQVRRIFYIHINMTPESWVKYYHRLQSIGSLGNYGGLDSTLTPKESSTSRALVPIGPVKDVPRDSSRIIDYKSPWDKFKAIVDEAKKSTETNIPSTNPSESVNPDSDDLDLPPWYWGS
jgi:hypothetical protein